MEGNVCNCNKTVFDSARRMRDTVNSVLDNSWRDLADLCMTKVAPLLTLSGSSQHGEVNRTALKGIRPAPLRSTLRGLLPRATRFVYFRRRCDCDDNIHCAMMSPRILFLFLSFARHLLKHGEIPTELAAGCAEQASI